LRAGRRCFTPHSLAREKHAATRNAAHREDVLHGLTLGAHDDRIRQHHQFELFQSDLEMEIAAFQNPLRPAHCVVTQVLLAAVVFAHRHAAFVTIASVVQGMQNKSQLVPVYRLPDAGPGGHYP
jgi:hypothetical protein